MATYQFELDQTKRERQRFKQLAYNRQCDLAKVETTNAELLAALQRAEQYLHIAIIDGRERKPKLDESTIKIAERDLEIVQAAIAKAKAGKE